MAKSLSDLRQHSRTYLDEIVEADWTDTQVDREINYAYMEVYTAVVETYEDYYRKVQTTDVEEDQQEYELPDDFFKLKRLEITYTTGGEARKATPYDWMQTVRPVNDANVGSTAQPRYDISGRFIRLMPIPTEDVDEGIRLTFIKQVVELSEDTDEIDIPFPDRYGRLIPLGACAQLLRKGQQEESIAARYSQDFQIGIEKMKQELEDRYLDGVKSILDTQQDWNDFSQMPGSFTIYT